MKSLKNSSINILIILCIVGLFSLVTFGKQQKSDGPFSLLFYNVENLFDTIDDPTKNDNEFLPQSKKEWNTYKYYKKLTHISQVIFAASEWNMPDIIGLCEVENATCLFDLTHKTNLAHKEYSFVHYDSPDARGIDVALIYQPKTFKVLHSHAISLSNKDMRLRTRDILYVKGIVRNTLDTLHIFVCHFPSKLGGASKSEPKRIFAAQVLRTAIDSIYSTTPQPYIIAMGDFNDEHTSTPIVNTLNATHFDTTCHSCLVSVIDDTFPGSYNYRGTWSRLDQTILSREAYTAFAPTQTIVRPPFITKTNKKDIIPYRTYNGPHYIGGYSDHFPIVLRLQLQQ